MHANCFFLPTALSGYQDKLPSMLMHINCVVAASDTANIGIDLILITKSLWVFLFTIMSYYNKTHLSVFHAF